MQVIKIKGGNRELKCGEQNLKKSLRLNKARKKYPKTLKNKPGNNTKKISQKAKLAKGDLGVS